MKNKFIELLRSTKREGIDRVIDYLENKSDFFTAPASTAFHGNYEGGLVEHSLNCCNLGLSIREVILKQKPELESKISKESVIIATLLHDICKANLYVGEIKSRKNALGMWEKYNGYTVDYSKFPIGHGEKSVIMLLMIGLKLSSDEILAIRWHMSSWDLPFQSKELQACYSTAKNNCPLCSIMQAADCLASGLLEEIRVPKSL